MTNIHPVPKKPVFAAKIDGLLKRMFQDGFVKYSRYGLRIPRKEAYFSYAAMTRDTRNADIGFFTKPSKFD
jgi:hypothetical protein